MFGLASSDIFSLTPACFCSKSAHGMCAIHAALFAAAGTSPPSHVDRGAKAEPRGDEELRWEQRRSPTAAKLPEPPVVGGWRAQVPQELEAGDVAAVQERILNGFEAEARNNVGQA